MSYLQFRKSEYIYVCINGYHNEDIYGHFYTGYGNTKTNFESFFSLIMSIKKFLQAINFPQNSVVSLNFKKNDEAPVWIEHDIPIKKGQVGNFVLGVRYRQYNTWQGVLLGMNDHMKREFKSILDLACIIDELFAPRAKERQTLSDFYILDWSNKLQKQHRAKS